MSATALTLATVQGSSGAGEKVGAVLVALLAAGAILGRPPLVGRRLHASLILATLILAPVLLVVDIWNTSVMHDVRDHAALSIAGVAIAVAALALLATLLRRWPQAFPLAAVLTLPFRVPVSSAGTTANLLVPLYVVIAAGALAYALPRLSGAARRAGGGRDREGDGDDRDRERDVDGRDREEDEEVGRDREEDEGVGRRDREEDEEVGRDREGGGQSGAGVEMSRNVRQGSGQTDSQMSTLAVISRRLLGRRFALEAVLAAYLVAYAIQAAYSPDFSKGLQNLLFFYVPFALLFRLLLEVRWSASLLRRCMRVAVAVAIALVAIGLIELAAKELLLNSSLVAKDVYGNYFRVNSLFYDPNIYGRFLALVMVLLAATVLFAARTRRDLLLLGLALAWLWVGLVTSISQSSMVALLLGLAVLAAFRWSARRVAGAGAAVLLAAVVFLLLAPSSLHFGVKGSGGSLNNASSGRVKLVEGGLKLFAKRPLQGFGSGSFAQEYRSREVSTSAAATSASHTTPVTIAAEQGVVGLALYVALLVLAFVQLCLGAGRAPPYRTRARDGGLRAQSPFRPAIVACFAALVLHTMAYADFLEDPTSWALLGIGLALAAAAPEQPSRARAADALARA